MNIMKHIRVVNHSLTYSMAQQPLNNFGWPLMRVYLSDSILVTLIF
jgi:hypothetical protein